MARRIRLLLAASLASLTCSKDTAGPNPPPPPPPPVDRVLLSGPATLFLGQGGQFNAAPVATNGDTLSRPVEWSSSDTTVAAVSQTGLVTSRALGVTTIRASAEGKSGTAGLTVIVVPVNRIDVTPANIDSVYVGDSLQLTATPRDSAGGALSGRVIAWSSSDTLKAVVTSSGMVRTRAPGSFAIKATTEGKTGGVFLNAQLFVAALYMPDSFSVGLHHTVRLIPDLRSASGTHLSGRPVAWSSSNQSVLDVQPNGVLVLHQLGTATIVARSDSLADSSVVTVVAEPVVVLLALRTADALPDTSVEAARATPYDAFSLPAVGNSVTWTSSDTTVIGVAAAPGNSWRAVLTGRRPGVSRITAFSGGVSSSPIDYTLRYPQVQFIAVPDSLMLTIGDTLYLGGVGKDRFGNRVGIDSFEQFVTSADTTIAVVTSNAPAYISGRKAGRTTVEFRLINGFADTVPVIVSPGTAPLLKWNAQLLAPNPYVDVTIQLVSEDSNGTPSTTPRNVQLSSSDTTVAVPTPSTITGMTAAESITIKSRNPGVATIVASGDSQFAALFIVVVDAPTGSVSLDPTPAALVVGDSLQLHATVRNYLGDVVAYPVEWNSSSPSRASVTAAGLMVAHQEGDVSVVARNGSKSDTAVFTITSTAAPVISGVSSLPLVPGAQVTLSGAGFDSDPAGNLVLVDSVPASVLAASDSQLTILLPPKPQWPCTSTHAARVVVRAGNRLGVDSMMLMVATQHTLAPGDVVLMAGDEASCNELNPPGVDALYVLQASNTSTSTPASFVFQGKAGSVTAAPPPATDHPPLGTVAAPTMRFSFDSLRRAASLHQRLLESNRALTRRSGAPAPHLRAARGAGPLRSVTATINGVARVRVPRLEDPDFCSSYRSIDATVVYTGTHVVMLEDKASPLAGTINGFYAALGQEFDNVMFPKLLANFGNPLRLDSLLDNNNRIAMVFSPLVNAYGASGFVVSCDFYPESVAPSSNTGEIFYAQVPTAPGRGFGAYTVDVWRWLIRSVIMHESKHLTAYAERLSRGAPIEDTWLEEASAVLAEELWSRDIYGTTWKGDATYRPTLYCDVRPTFPECADRPYSMFNAFAFLYDYIRQLEKRTPLGPASPDDPTFYGSGWSFLRWGLDQSTVSEAQFLRDLTQEPALTGVANLQARTGRTFSELLPDWAAALYSENWGLPPSRPAWSMPSWKTDDIFPGMNQDFPLDFPDGHPLRGRGWPLASFELPVTGLPPGGWALFAGGGMHSTKQLLAFVPPSVGPLPPSVRVHLLRLR